MKSPSMGAFRALSRARIAILTVALTYALSVLVGLTMVHTGNEFATSYRDGLVTRARENDPAATAYRDGDLSRAGLADFEQNLFMGAVHSAVTGLAVVTAYPIVIYRGWVGGIVSIDSAHASRLAEPREAAYYIITLLLQLIPYSLAGGAGVNLGLAQFRPLACYQGEKLLSYPKEAIWDVLRIFVLVVPLFFIASFWEFYSPWNR